MSGNKSSLLTRLISFFVSLVVLVGLVSLRAYWRQADALSRAESLAAAGDYNSAFYAFGDAMRRSPKDPLPYYRRAVAMFTGQQNLKAQADLNEVIRMRPSFGPAYRLRSAVKRSMGLADAAQEDELKADELGADKELKAILAITKIPEK